MSCVHSNPVATVRGKKVISRYSRYMIFTNSDNVVCSHLYMIMEMLLSAKMLETSEYETKFVCIIISSIICIAIYIALLILTTGANTMSIE